jgi:hypothetical protein
LNEHLKPLAHNGELEYRETRKLLSGCDRLLMSPEAAGSIIIGREVCTSAKERTGTVVVCITKEGESFSN